MVDENSTFLSTPWRYANFSSPSSPIPSSSSSSSILNYFLQAIRFFSMEKASLTLKSLALKILRRITSLFSSSNSGYSSATSGGGVSSSSFFGFSASGVGGYSSAIGSGGDVFSSSSFFGFSASGICGYSSATGGGGVGGVTS
ncbi:Uncharacterized protein Fot_01049 [Forsythia ovata]|uniref:Uncharacterized protein n=1 Tax=Forsythia ovata TaxID=205694 RepID=A0ABD1X6W6_9LAMI